MARRADGATYEARLAAFAGQPALRAARHPHAHGLRTLSAAPGDRRWRYRATFTAGEIGSRRQHAPVRSSSPANATRFVRRTLAERTSMAARAGGHADCWVRARTTRRPSPSCRRCAGSSIPRSCVSERTAFASASSPVPPTRCASAAARPRRTRCGSPSSHRPPRPLRRTLATALAAPLVAHVDAGWVVSTRALAQALDPRATGAACFLVASRPASAATRSGPRRSRWDDGPPVPCEERTAEHPRVGLLRRAQLGRLELSRLPRPPGGLRRLGQPRVRPAAGARPRLGRHRRSAEFWDALRRRGAALSRRRHHPPRPRASRPRRVQPSAQGRALRARVAEERRSRPHLARGPDHPLPPHRRAALARGRAGDGRRARRTGRQGRQPAPVRMADDRARGARRLHRRAATATPPAHFADGGASMRASPRRRRPTGRSASSPTASPRSMPSTANQRLLDWLTRYADALVTAPPDRFRRRALRPAAGLSRGSQRRSALSRARPRGRGSARRSATGGRRWRSAAAPVSASSVPSPRSSRPRPPRSHPPPPLLLGGRRPHGDDGDRGTQVLTGLRCD